MELNRRWHVDAWAVRDGMAFASQRPADDPRAAGRTVFIGVPTLDAAPVGRLSAALWATRANFQDGFRTENGEEIGFEGLEQVRELVRRGYLAGGIGPGPFGGGPPERPLGPDEGGAGGEPRDVPPWPTDALAADRGFERDPWFENAHRLARRLDRTELFAALTRPHNVEGLTVALRECALAGLELWAEDIDRSPDDEAGLARFAEWIRLLGTMDLWGSGKAFFEALTRSRVGTVIAHRFDFLPDEWQWPWRSEALPMEQMVFYVPCALRPGWDPSIRRLSDKLLLATSTLDYFANNRQLEDFAPSLLAALSVVVQRGTQFAIPFSGGRIRRLQAALSWLSEQMPQHTLPQAAEQALTTFAWNELRRR